MWISRIPVFMTATRFFSSITPLDESSFTVPVLLVVNTRSIFSSLGVLVDLVDTRDRLLSFLDHEISDALSYHIRKNNVIIRHNEEYHKIDGTDEGVIMHLKSGKKFKASALLWANGRSGNTGNLGLENIGLAANGRGQLSVNEYYQTDVDNIYAVGDVIGWPSLASASYDQGRFAANNIKGDEPPLFVSSVPAGIYTIPEISSLGKTEEEADQKGGPL